VSDWRDIFIFFNEVRLLKKNSRTGHDLKSTFKPEKNYTSVFLVLVSKNVLFV